MWPTLTEDKERKLATPEELSYFRSGHNPSYDTSLTQPNYRLDLPASHHPVQRRSNLPGPSQVAHAVGSLGPPVRPQPQSVRPSRSIPNLGNPNSGVSRHQQAITSQASTSQARQNHPSTIALFQNQALPTSGPQINTPVLRNQSSITLNFPCPNTTLSWFKIACRWTRRVGILDYGL